MIYRVAIGLFIEFSIYTKTFILDIESLFSQMDLLTMSKTRELVLLEYCKEAVDFHDQIYR